jgi:serine/threonine-protein kinase
MTSRFIGNYRIIDYIGGGGFGSVFRAEDATTPGRVVAIKELHKKHTRNAAIKQRFFQEAVAMARLDHPNLPRLFTFGEDHGSYYLVMEFISGSLLSEEIDRGKIAPARAVSITEQVLEAVKYAHSSGIIHRDLKPDNIMLVGEPDLKVKVLDFGIARMVGGENLTLTGEGFGTPAYMSPERMMGTTTVDHRTDIYSLGIILTEMLSGQRPFQSEATDPAAYWLEMRSLHESTELPSLSELGVPGELERIIRRAAAKRVEDRYQSSDEMLGDLRSIDSSGAVSDSPTSLVRLTLTTMPGGAEVFVDELPRGTSDSIRGKIQIDGLNPGLHDVRVSKAGYNEYRITVSLQPNSPTDLQVALAARSTMAMPQSGGATVPVDAQTNRVAVGNEVATALLVVDSLPEGSTVFVGSQAVATADASGRASLQLRPGVHDVHVSAPSGELGKQRITVSDRDTGSLKTISFQVATTQATAVGPTPAQPSRSGKRMAVVGTATLLIALAIVTFFVLRGRAPEPSGSQPQSVGLSDPQAASTTTTAQASTDSSANPADKPSQTTEAQPSATQTKADAGQTSQSGKKPGTVEGEKSTQPSQTVPTKPTTTPDAVSSQQPKVAEQDSCLGVAVFGPAGQPLRRMRVALALDGGTGFHGQTNDRGRWHTCGLKGGQRGKITVFGPAGAVVGSQSLLIVAGTNFVRMQAESPSFKAPGQDVPPGVFPRRKPLRRRP